MTGIPQFRTEINQFAKGSHTNSWLYHL